MNPPFNDFSDVEIDSQGNLDASLGFVQPGIQQLSTISDSVVGGSVLAMTSSLSPDFVTSNGAIFAVLANGTLAEYDSLGNLVANPPFTATSAVAVDSAGAVYLSTSIFGPDEILQLTTLSSVAFGGVAIAQTPFLATALLSADNSFYAAFADGMLNRYDTNGNLLASVQTPGVVYTDLTFAGGELFASAAQTTAAPAPEPASGGLLAAGLALLSGKRKRS